MKYAVIETPLGPLTVASTEAGLSSVLFGMRVPPGGVLDAHANRAYIQQLEEYFSDRRRTFDMPLDYSGTPFQTAVWLQLLRIPYGQTTTYGKIANSLGKPQAARAVGMANHDNPIAVVIPCHRVIGSNGALTGYAGGLHLKKQLLSMERGTLFT